jgi:hypothetical protein
VRNTCEPIGNLYSRKSICWFRVGTTGAALVVRLSIVAAIVLPLHSALAQYIEQGPKLIGSGIAGGAVWTQQGDKLVGSGGSSAFQGAAVALSEGGNSAIVGGPQGTREATGLRGYLREALPAGPSKEQS